MPTRYTFCRTCEATCGLEVDVIDNRVVAIRPDKAHVVSRGYSCVKGIHFDKVHHSPDRVTQPLKRIGSRRMYGTGTCDTTNKLRVCEDMYGSPFRLSYPDVDFGRIEVPVRVSDEMMPRTVAVPQCRGHREADGLDHARRRPGVNSNLRAGDGATNIDPLSAMSHLSFIWVRITRQPNRAQ
jgi:anaerobic selenocysteine-containing dehydrogenase